jgi:hypothetical protein
MAPNSFETMNDTCKIMPQLSNMSNLTNKAKQWPQAGKGAQNDSLLGMAAASLFDVESFARTMLPESSVRVQQQLSQPAVRPEEITSQVLAELAGDLFDDDLFDSTEFEPLPLRQGNAAFRRNSLQHYQSVQNQSVQSRFTLLENTLSQILTHERPTPRHLVMSQPAPPPPPPLLAAVVTVPVKRELIEPMDPPASASKKQRTETPEEAARRFRPYQAEQWSEKFEELCEFKKNKGHCCVPHTFTDNPALARWVKRQRYQYKLKNEGKQSTMTDERVVALDNKSFIWDSHGAAWQERLNELCDYKKDKNGHCNVPSNFPSNPQLATWVKCQRRQHKLYWDGKTSNMTLRRIAELENVGFEWELRGSKNAAAASW